MKTTNILSFGLTLIIIFSFSCSIENKIVLKRFKEGNTKVIVCPVHILSGQNSSIDTISSTKIIEYINSKRYAKAQGTNLQPVTNNEWRRNEAKMLTVSINFFIDFVKENNFPDDTYILYAEFLKSEKNKSIRAIHYCLLDNKGEIAMRGLINSHWKEFQKVNPKTNDDCVAVFINGFEGKMHSNK